MSDKPIVIVGAGPAGLMAAYAAATQSSRQVIVIDRDKDPGGILNQCIHAGFGITQFKEELTGPEYANRVFKMAMSAGVEVLFSSTVIKVSADLVVTVVSPEIGLKNIEAAAIILTTGCRERARGVIHIPGERPSGIFCAGLAQKLVNIDGYLPGKRIVILGSGDIGLIMARRLTLQGAKVLAVIEAASYIGGLARNEVQCLQDFGIPLYLSHTITDIIGKKRVEKVVVSKVGPGFKATSGSEFTIDCDTVLLSIGLIPENELAEAANIQLSPITNGAIIDENYMTSVPGIFTCGNALHVHDLVDQLAIESAMVGKNAASYADRQILSNSCREVSAQAEIRYIVPNRVSGDTDVQFFFRAREPMRDVVLRVHDFKKKVRFLQPNEMASFKVPKEYLQKSEKVNVWIEKN